MKAWVKEPVMWGGHLVSRRGVVLLVHTAGGPVEYRSLGFLTFALLALGHLGALVALEFEAGALLQNHSLIFISDIPVHII